MSITELIQTLAALTMLGSLALICWCGHRQDQRRADEEQAARTAQRAARETRRAADWQDMCRQTASIDDYSTEEEKP